MPRQIVINLMIAIMWMFLQESFLLSDFIIGFLIGAGLLLLLNRFIPDYYYFRRVWKIISLVLLFLKELLVANIDVVKWVYRPKQTMKPGMIAYKTELTTNWEITILAILITLTPGTLSVLISYDNSTVYIHAMDVPDVDVEIEKIKNSFERAILEVSK